MIFPFFLAIIITAARVFARRRFVLIDAVIDMFITGTMLAMVGMALSTILVWRIPGMIFFIMATGIPAILLMIMKCDRIIDSAMGYDDPDAYTERSILEDREVIYG